MTGGPLGKEEKNLPINILELKAAKLTIVTFTRLKTAKVIHIQRGNIPALTYLLKMGGNGQLGNESNSPGNLVISNK